ncbi:hypothetical protein ACHAXS_009863 [Conticribra weissflogii]
MPHGRSWIIVNKELLIKYVLPTHFSSNKFESFNRQVNGWGFKVREYYSLDDTISNIPALPYLNIVHNIALLMCHISIRYLAISWRGSGQCKY